MHLYGLIQSPHPPPCMHACMHAVTLALDAAYDDVYSVQMWAAASIDQAFDYLQVWLSPTTAYASGTSCATNVCLLEGSQGTADEPGTVLCPPANGTKYVTILKVPYGNSYWNPSGDRLALDEVKVNLGGA